MLLPNAGGLRICQTLPMYCSLRPASTTIEIRYNFASKSNELEVFVRTVQVGCDV